MPHEVIMPALGMSQDEGIIVAWLKQPGDAVAEGDALMEVETDKATMEVEAQASGYLQDVRAKAGESVPVGQPVAVISDQAEHEPGNDDSADTPHEPPEGQDSGNSAEDAVLSGGHPVIMPALGMAQDTGLIVVWHKEPGAEIGAGDVLMEVETDKATMEVEADRAGFLAAILAEAGDDVPVGEVVAVLSETAPDAPIRRSFAGRRSATAPASQKGAAEPEPAPGPVAAQAAPQSTASPEAEGRILASPKARRLAAEEGLDLTRLAAAGHPQPFHAADIATLRDLAEPGAATPQQAAPAARAALSELTAEVPAAAFDGFLAWQADEPGDSPEAGRILAAFASGALRGALSLEGPLTLATEDADAHWSIDDADLHPLAADLPASDATPQLILRDFTSSYITAAKTAAAIPVLTLTRRGDMLVVHLLHDERVLPAGTARSVVTGLADRIADPLCHLL